ncbi:MAG: hypothetical protein LQ337_001798 [Flavoplaca oasis]|nr:MAG: hypothetical protein LQ337_001798 [Flavoplaca oasis]
MATYYRNFENFQGARPEPETAVPDSFINEVVNNIIFSSDRTGDLVATGLNFTANNQSFIANASREVIISGGMIKSPQMLELSGIGDAKLLESFGIQTFIDNPNVGESLQDHPHHYQENGRGLLADGVSQTAQLSWDRILTPEQQARPQELVGRY